MNTPALAFVDLETTGTRAQYDRILEIGIVTVEGETVTEWSSLINPGEHVPTFIQSFTGISDEMVEGVEMRGKLTHYFHVTRTRLPINKRFICNRNA